MSHKLGLSASAEQGRAAPSADSTAKLEQGPKSQGETTEVTLGLEKQKLSDSDVGADQPVPAGD